MLYMGHLRGDSTGSVVLNTQGLYRVVMPTTTTVEMDEKGRLVVPKPARKALEVDGEEAIVEITVQLAEEDTDSWNMGVDE